MSTGKIGGILAIISGALVITGFLYYQTRYGAPIMAPFMLPSFLVAVVVLVGGILGVRGKKWAGILSLAGGTIWLVGMLLSMFAGVDLVYVISFIIVLADVPVNFLYLGAIEVLLAIIGGILILVSNE